MQHALRSAFGALLILSVVPAQCQAPRDVPASHWARTAVVETVRLGSFELRNGQFAGSSTVSRTELAQILARTARALDSGKRVAPGAKPSGPGSGGSVDWQSKPATRYEVAATLWRVCSYAGEGLRKVGVKRYGKSDALPPPVKVTVKASDPAYSSLKYLAARRMVLAGSPLLKRPGTSAATGADVVTCVAQMVVGLVDQVTDEPLLRMELEGAADQHKH